MNLHKLLIKQGASHDTTPATDERQKNHLNAKLKRKRWRWDTHVFLTMQHIIRSQLPESGVTWRTHPGTETHHKTDHDPEQEIEKPTLSFHMHTSFLALEADSFLA